MRPVLLLLISALSALPGLVLSQSNAPTASSSSFSDYDSRIAEGYSEYVSEMNSAARMATATYSWARISSMSYKTTATASVEQAEATSSAVTTETVQTPIESQAVTSEPAAVATQTIQPSSKGSGDHSMMAYGIGIAFGVLLLIVGLVTSTIIYNRKQARKQFLLRTRGLQQMAEAQA